MAQAVEQAWAPIAEFPAYEVSNDGIVRNRETGLVLTPEAGHRGHLRVTLYNKHGPSRVFVHHLVLQHFHRPAPDGLECAHWDGDPANNRLENLRWTTRKGNAEDRRRHGHDFLGEQNHNAKLTAADVTRIRDAFVAGAKTADLAAHFGVYVSVINRIVIGKGWRHLGGPLRATKPRNKVDHNRVLLAVSEVEAGRQITDVAKAYGVSKQSIRRRQLKLAASGPSEKEIQQTTIDYWRQLGVPGSLVAAVPLAGAFGQAGLTRGLFDLIVMSPKLGDRTGWLELKRDSGALSEAQREFKLLMIARGTPFAVACGCDQAIAALTEWGAVRPIARAAA